MKSPDCPHSEHIVVLCATGPHYAKKLCRRCKRFMGWVVRPESSQLRATILAKVNELWNASPTPEERAFLQTVADADGKIGPRQEARLNGLWARYLVDQELAQRMGK